MWEGTLSCFTPPPLPRKVGLQPILRAMGSAPEDDAASPGRQLGAEHGEPDLSLWGYPSLGEPLEAKQNHHVVGVCVCLI